MHVVAVFAQRHVTHVMRGAFNRPVAAPPLLQQHSTRLAHREVGHPAEHRAGRFPRALYVALTRPVHDSCCPGPLKRGAIAGGVFQVPNLQGPVAVADRLDAVPLLVVDDDGRQIEEPGEVVVPLGLIGLDDHQVIAAPIVDGASEAALRVEGIAGHDRVAEVTTGE